MSDDENDRVTAPPPVPPGHELVPEDQPLPLRSGARRLITSSKGLLCVAALVGVCIMNYLGRIDGERALEFITWIIGFYVAGVAVEDGIDKLRRNRVSIGSGFARDLLEGVLAGVKAFRGEDLTPTRTPGPMPEPESCFYVVNEEDDEFEAVLAAALRDAVGAPAPAEIIQGWISVVSALNGNQPPAQWWLPKRRVRLPRVVCLYLEKLHPEVTPQ